MNISELWHEPARYQIKIMGCFNSQWFVDWFEGVTIESEGNVTTLTGEIVDQAALRGLLYRIWDMGMRLISVNLIESNQVDEI